MTKIAPKDHILIQKLLAMTDEHNAAFDDMQEAITISDPEKPDNPLVYVNPAFEKMTGYTFAEVHNTNCRFLQGKETDPKAVATMRNAIEKKVPVTVELINYRKDGTPFWNRITVSPVYADWGKLAYYLGLQRDITTIKNQKESVDNMKAAVERLQKCIAKEEEVIQSHMRS